MFEVYYLCSFRPVWYPDGEPLDNFPAAVAAAVSSHRARAGAPVQVRDDAGRVLFALP